MFLPITIATTLGLFGLIQHASSSPIANINSSIPFNAVPMSAKAATTNLNLNQEPSTWFVCSGSPLCRITPHMKENCDIAINFQVYRFPDYFYNPTHSTVGRGPGDENGVRKPCWKGDNPFDIGCGIEVEGPESCQRSGEQLWWDYQDIRQAGCTLCASKTWGPGNKCRTKVDYVTNCDFGGDSPGQEPRPGADGIGGGSGGMEEDH